MDYAARQAETWLSELVYGWTTWQYPDTWLFKLKANDARVSRAEKQTMQMF